MFDIGSQVHGNQFAPLDPVKTPGNNQWQRQLGGNTYNEQLSNTSQTESLRYRSESGIPHMCMYAYGILLLSL